MNEKHLNQAGIKGDHSSTEAQGSQDSRQCGERHTQVIDWEQGQEVVHGLVQALLLLDNKQDQAIAHDGDGIEEKKREGQPGFQGLHPWEPGQYKAGTIRAIDPEVAHEKPGTSVISQLELWRNYIIIVSF